MVQLIKRLEEIQRHNSTKPRVGAKLEGKYSTEKLIQINCLFVGWARKPLGGSAIGPPLVLARKVIPIEPSIYATQ